MAKTGWLPETSGEAIELLILRASMRNSPFRWCTVHPIIVPHFKAMVPRTQTRRLLARIHGNREARSTKGALGSCHCKKALSTSGNTATVDRTLFREAVPGHRRVAGLRLPFALFSALMEEFIAIAGLGAHIVNREAGLNRCSLQALLQAQL